MGAAGWEHLLGCIRPRLCCPAGREESLPLGVRLQKRGQEGNVGRHKALLVLHRVGGASHVSCWETRGLKRGEGFEEYYSDTLGAKW